MWCFLRLVCALSSLVISIWALRFGLVILARCSFSLGIGIVALMSVTGGRSSNRLFLFRRRSFFLASSSVANGVEEDGTVSVNLAGPEAAGGCGAGGFLRTFAVIDAATAAALAAAAALLGERVEDEEEAETVGVGLAVAFAGGFTPFASSRMLAQGGGWELRTFRRFMAARGRERGRVRARARAGRGAWGGGGGVDGRKEEEGGG